MDENKPKREIKVNLPLLIAIILLIILGAIFGLNMFFYNKEKIDKIICLVIFLPAWLLSLHTVQFPFSGAEFFSKKHYPTSITLPLPQP